MVRKIQLLDATLRDGGQGLEDLHKMDFPTKFSQKSLNIP